MSILTRRRSFDSALSATLSRIFPNKPLPFVRPTVRPAQSTHIRNCRKEQNMNIHKSSGSAPKLDHGALPPAWGGTVESAASEPREDQRYRSQTALHLRDILDAHGAGKRWPNLAIPEGRLVRIEAPEPFASPCGSTAALCAAEGDAVSF
jgi:hypothetical protein